MILDKVKPGDVLFLKGKGIIEAVTFSNVRHVGIIYDEFTVFETDIWKRRAGSSDINKYENKNIEIWRMEGIDQYKVQKLCEKYNKAPYSHWDIFTNLITAPLHPRIRRKITALLGTQCFMICSELTGRILYEASLEPFLKDYESLQPIDLYRIFLHHPDIFRKL